jgi:hypothetical protein
MGWLKKATKSVKKLGSNPVQWGKDLWNDPGGRAVLGFGALGPLGAVAGASFGPDGLLSRFDPEGPDPGPLDPYTQLGERYALGNPEQMAGWYTKARDAYTRAGYSPAAAAAGAVRARNRGWLRNAQTSEDYWRSLSRLFQGYQEKADSIDTTTPGVAFLRGSLGF